MDSGARPRTLRKDCSMNAGAQQGFRCAACMKLTRGSVIPFTVKCPFAGRIQFTQLGRFELSLTDVASGCRSVTH